MQAIERDTSRDARDDEYALRHQQSVSSDLGFRALVPMWDSSDPERCPPPLPLNPQSPKGFTSRAGTSSAIQSAHAALSERARESALVPSLMKNTSHRRMQSMQPSSVRDLSLMIEGNASPNVSPTKSPEKYSRPQTPVRPRDAREEARYIDRESMTGTPTPGPSLTPIVRPTVRRPPPQSILGENTPPQSSTMLALQNMPSQQPTPAAKEPENPLSNITNASSAVVRHPQNLDLLSNQILSLTNIATGLQKEMSALSRRSRDNATDLLSLKEATTTRDEDIRKSLRELIITGSDGNGRLPSRDPFSYYIDNKPHNISPNTARSAAFQLPRIPSPKSFSDSIDRGSMSTPSLAGSEAPASIALLEKIIRDMGTKEGQDSLLGRLIEVSSKLSGMATATKVEELVQEVRAQSEQAVVLNADVSRSRNFSFDDGSSHMDLPERPRSGPVLQRVEHLMKNESRRSSDPSAGRGVGLLNEDLINIIRSVKDSVAQGGGLTAEVKALVRELRGEVLGMGREIGRRLEQAASRKPVDDHDSPSKDEVARVIDEGLEQMKDQLNHVLREHRRQSSSSNNTQKTAVDYQEIYNALRAALQDNERARGEMPDLSREDVIEAVKDAWENYKPEIEVQQLGLEREEVLACLKEGLQEYAPRDDRPPSATRDEVFTAVVEGLRHFVPPQVETPATLSRDEIIEAVRDCLEEFEFPVAASAIGNNEITHDDVVHAVREGLHDLDLSSSRALVPAASNNDEVTARLHEITDYLRREFKAVSEEAKENVAANGRDTEQVLDATKDGFENLRAAIESYVDRAAGINGQEEFLDDLLKSLEDFKADIAGMVTQSNEEAQDKLQTELEGLRDVVNSSMVPAPQPQSHSNNQEVLEALNTGFNNLRSEILRPRAETTEILDALNDGLNDLRVGMDRITNKPMDLTANDEILDALKVGLDSVRADIESIRDNNNNDRAVVPLDPAVDTTNDDLLDTLKSGLNAVRSDIEALRDSTAAKAVATVDETESNNNNEELLDALKDGLDAVRLDIEALRESTHQRSVSEADEIANDEILDALKTGLDSVRSDIEALRDSNNERAVAAVDTRSEHLDDSEEKILEALKSGLESLRSDIESLRDSNNERALATVSKEPEPEQAVVPLDTLRQDDIKNLEVLITQLGVKVEAMEPETESLQKEDLGRMEEMIRNVQDAVDELSSREPATTARAVGTDDSEVSAEKTDFTRLEDMIRNVQDAVDELSSREPVTTSREIVNIESEPDTQKVDFGRMEEMIRNVQDAVDELSSREPATTARAVGTDDSEVSAEKTDFTRLEDMIRNVQDAVDELSSREPITTARAVPKGDSDDSDVNGEDPASKDDVVAIETILRNTKARLDDLIDGEQAVRKDHVDAIEELLLETRESMGSLSAQVDTVARKEEISNLESLIAQVTVGIVEMKERTEKENENPEKVTKTDVEAVEAVVLELKEALDGVAKTDFATFANKEDITSLETVVKEFQEKLDTTVDSHTKAVAVRDEEMTGVGERVTEVKTFLEEFQETIKLKLEEGSTGVESVSKLLETMGEKIDKNDSLGQDLKDMFEMMKSEFEDSKAVVSGVKVESNEKLEEATTTLGTKIDDKIGELVTKYEEVQTMLDERNKVSEARDVATEAAVVGTKAVADELKLLIDTLGSTVTDSLEKMEEASKTVFTSVEDLVLKNEDNHTEDKAEHQQTRDQVNQALSAVEGLKGEVGDYQPKILEAVKDVLLLVGEHFEHSKTANTDTQDKLIEFQPSEELKMLLPPEKYDNTEVHEKLNKLVEEKYDDAEVREKLALIMEQKYDDAEVRERLDLLIAQKYDDAEVREKLDIIVAQKYDDSEVREKLALIMDQKYDDSEVREKLALIMDQKYDDVEVRERLDLLIEQKYDDTVVRETLDLIVAQKYDDAPVHEKLDKMAEHNTTAEQAFSRLDTLDKVHASVVKTAADISEFLSNQTQRIADDHEDRERSLQDTIIATERKLAEKEHVEASVMSLREEEQRLRDSILNLQAEQESLIRQRTRLTAGVSSLETAMRLRKDELYEMEGRAETLERRILEGVMDHSRVLLMSKGNKGGDAMSRKRVKKPANDDPDQTPRKPMVNMALTARRSIASPAQAGTGRRIVSLSQINNNVASTGFKRSQSVRTPAGKGKAYRKRSWGGDLDHGFDQDKENVGMGETVEEVDEHDARSIRPESELPSDGTTALDSEINGDGIDSDNETLRRSSRGTVVTNSTDMYTDSEGGYSEYSETGSEWTESHVGTDAGTDAGTDVGDGNELVVYGR
ncbi:hypothetical protein B0J13DRAFT_521472 [Dactylonectria estremocensis]|uniref:Transport protein USO1 n=1 Tax=Dactylonectria estremocensis TaxID=1079267 RepID=A0A9P9F4C6_9HYPO|nr:hypothetical protein B0J13DRAFT_521472 [Dactylonectria estremocensis]